MHLTARSLVQNRKCDETLSALHSEMEFSLPSTYCTNLHQDAPASVLTVGAVMLLLQRALGNKNHDPAYSAYSARGSSSAGDTCRWRSQAGKSVLTARFRSVSLDS